ncbi:hypothetical protein [Bacillus sp. ISL-7]|uniref:hypothetical protein n=1 Tax=Bacillus sp. ISL-7 TaxID=2819136 RepID=UPI001BE68F52|nr:hypothetical protein [Bacillus sp. ISL-7]MBT2735699.1 hypothetical protein [Bacillus sp. ISL-7]
MMEKRGVSIGHTTMTTLSYTNTKHNRMMPSLYSNQKTPSKWMKQKVNGCLIFS